MDAHTLKLKKQALFDKLIHSTKPIKRVLGMSTHFKLMVSATVIYCAAIYWGGFSFGQRFHPDGYWLGIVCGFVALFIAAMVSSYLEGNPLFKDLPEQWVLKKILNILSISTRLSSAQIQEIVDWSSKYPEIKAACVEIGARNKGGVLTQRDHRLIWKTMARIERYKDQHDWWTIEENKYRVAEQKMYEIGLIQEIKTRSEQIELQNKTPPSRNSLPPPRL